MTNKKFILIVVALLLSSCAPMYETQYSYLPPRGTQGQLCLSNCEMAKMNCEHREDMDKQDCERRADRDYDYCRYRSGEKYCYRDTCSADYSYCVSSYNACYRGCGGRVDEHQVCVAFCDQR
ncbi:MAG: hypothetical protein IT292_02185 [Deltaproteobacteria bacterium]|nr:hypothetical protein [Deltaproteobacteria bacterium]